MNAPTGLRGFSVENLKAFKREQIVETAPITLLYGANSSGKSTLLQALALLRQSAPQGGTVNFGGQPELAFQGELADLGSFPAAVFAHNVSSEISIGLMGSASSVPDPPFDPDTRTWGPAQELAKDTIAAARWTFGYSKAERRVVFRALSLEVRNVKISFEPSKIKSDHSGGPFQVFRLKGRGKSADLVKLVQAIWGEHLDEPHESWLAETVAPIPRRQWRTFAFDGWFPIPNLMLDGHSNDEQAEQISARLSLLLSPLFRAVVAVRSSIGNKFDYIGPMRALPERFKLDAGESVERVSAVGDNVESIMSRRSGLTEKVNHWFTRLEIPYGLELKQIDSGELGLGVGSIAVLKLEDMNRTTAVTVKDVGFGLSQVLPVIVALLIGRGRTIAIEQPEVHIHPRLQASLADLLIEAAIDRNNRLVIETHSEHLLLRLQRRIREGAIKPDDVAVYNVGPGDDGSAEVVRVRLDPSGDFLDPWPQGFFPERVRERLGVG